MGAENTAIEAAMRADAMLEAGDLEGLAVWKRILRSMKWEIPRLAQIRL